MVVKIELGPQFLARMDGLAPLASRSAVVKRLIEVGLAVVEEKPDLLRRPRPTTTAVKS